MSRETVLVTGAGGFVCSEIALALTEAGYQVVALDQAFDADARARLTGVPLIEGTLPEAVAALGHVRPAAVVHGAAITAAPGQVGLSRAGHLRRNVDMLSAVLDWARGAGATRFLFLSSMGVFDPRDGPAPDNRFTEATQSSATCAYCVAKQIGEALTTGAAEPGFATLSLRLGNTFGPHEAVRPTRQTLCLVSRMLSEARATGVITVETPQAEREWVWLPDLARGIARLVAEFPKGGTNVLHAGSPPVLSDLATAQLIAGRLPGTLIRLAAPPHSPIRPPMASAIPSVFEQTQWTPLSAALDGLVRDAEGIEV